MSNLDGFLNSLQRVRSTGTNRWMASCPTGNHAHGDRHPSLTIGIGNEGRILIKCQSQMCGIDEIASAVGMSVSDFMPENLGFHRMKPQRIPFNALDVMNAIRGDLMVCLIIANDMKAGKIPDDISTSLLSKLIGRVTMAIEMAGGE